MRPDEVKTDGKFDHALERNRMNWEEMRKSDPDRFKLELSKARTERLLLSTPNSSAAFPELVKEWIRWNDRLWAWHKLRVLK